jgi:Neurotransmitter-gated ion-channel ligand binding domain/Neurotransmitter-gated ion-channel transmembrane region
VARERACWRASALRLAACVSALIGGGASPAFPAEPPADVVADLEREVGPRSGAACPDAKVLSLTRPDTAAGPTVVGLGVFFQDVASLSDVDQTLDADVYVFARWRDTRLADPARGDGSVECPVLENRMWSPALEPENLRGRQAFYPARFLVDGSGVVTYARRLWVKISHPLDFRDFPLDRHRWKVTLWPVLSRTDEIVFHPLRRVTGMSERLSIQGWRVGEPRAKASTGPRVARAGSWARFDVELTLDRDWSYHAWKLGVPLTLIVLMAYGVYFIPASAVPQQIGLGMTSMLTLIAYMMALGSTLPRISYLTRADRFFVGSAVLVFLGLVKAVAAAALAQRPDARVLDRVNRWGRWVFPLAILANFALAFLS